MRRGRDGSIIGKGLICVAHEKDVLGFQVGVDEVKVMEDYGISTKTSIKSQNHPQATLVKSCRAKF